MPTRKPLADLRVYWSRRERTYRDGQSTPGALVYNGPKTTGGLLAQVFERVTIADLYSGSALLRASGVVKSDASDNRTLAQELEARGYDLSTLRFQIRKKAAP